MQCEEEEEEEEDAASEDEVGTTNYFLPPKMPLHVFLGSGGRRISFCSQIAKDAIVCM